MNSHSTSTVDCMFVNFIACDEEPDTMKLTNIIVKISTWLHSYSLDIYVLSRM